MNRRMLMADCMDQKAVKQGSGMGHDLVKQTFQIFIASLDDILRGGKRRSESIITAAEFNKIGIMVPTLHANPR